MKFKEILKATKDKYVETEIKIYNDMSNFQNEIEQAEYIMGTNITISRFNQCNDVWDLISLLDELGFNNEMSIGFIFDSIIEE